MTEPTNVPEPRHVPLGRRLAWGLLAGLGVAALAGAASLLGLLGSYELRTLDWRHQALSRHGPAADRVAVILIDEYSIRTLREEEGVHWPWPRDVYEPLLGYLARSGAKAAVFDLVFADPDRSRSDRAFAEAAKAFGSTVHAVKLESFEDRWAGEAAAIERGKLPVEGWPFPLREGIRSLLPPLEDHVEAAALLGVVNVRMDPDGRLRRADLLFPYPDRSTLLPSLGLAGALAAVGRGERLAFEDGALRVGDRRLPVGPDGRALVRFYGGVQAIRTENAASVIRSFAALEEGEQPVVPRDAFEGRVVVIGVNAAGMEDIVTAPVADRYPGPEFMATVAANVLGEDFLREPGPIARLLALGSLGAIAGLAAFALWRPGRAAAGLAGIGLAYTAIAILAFQGGLVLEVFFPSLVILGILGAHLLMAFLAEGRQKREVSRAFAQYMSPDVIRDLLRSPDALRLGGETREITVYFSDLRGFSTFSEGMSPQDLVSFLNVYLTAMTDAILDRRGTIDKYEGDAIMAFWGAPLPLPAHCLEACLSVLEQRRVLATLNERFRAEGRPPLSVRIGLNAGPAVVGNMGSTRRFAYTAMGDTVNLASRLEGANKLFGTDVMMSEAVRTAAGDRIAARRLGRIRVVGKAVPTTVFELLGESGDLSERDAERLREYHGALSLLEGGRAREARAIFESLLEGGIDPVVDLCLAKAREIETSSAPWDGVWVLKEKG